MFTSHQPVIKLDQNDILLGVIVDSKRKNEAKREREYVVSVLQENELSIANSCV